MKNKTVTMDFEEHEQLVERLDMFLESKLIVLDVIIRHDSYGCIGSYSNPISYSINTTDEFKPIIEKIIEDGLHGEIRKEAVPGRYIDVN